MKNVSISNTLHTVIEKFKPVSTGHSHWHTYISSFIFIHFNKDNISLFSITAGIVGVFTAIVVASIRCHFLPLQSQYAYVITVTKNYARKLKDEQILPFDSSFAACNQWRCSYLNWLKILISKKHHIQYFDSTIWKFVLYISFHQSKAILELLEYMKI